MKASDGARREAGGASEPESPEAGRGSPAAARASEEALFVTCPSCRGPSYRKDVERRLLVCGPCGHHFRLTVEERLRITVDRGTWRETSAGLVGGDPLQWTEGAGGPDYPARLAAAREQTGHREAVVTGTAEIEGVPVALGVMDFHFMGGTMGTAVGEKLALLVDLARETGRALVVFTASGGARMQEGTLSLVQMAKVVSALQRLRERGLAFVCVLTDPTTGGVCASLAMRGDVQIAEPGALIGFAGPRVIEQTIQQTLPPDFQRAETLLGRGQIDMVVHRGDLRTTLGRVLRALTKAPDAVG